MAAYSPGGTAPAETSRSLPRLSAENSVRTSTSPGASGASATWRSSATPGAV